jgi:hypothetical protein
MADNREVDDTLAKLPRALVERLTRPFSRFVQIETAAGAVLLAATLVALLLSNSPWADAFFAIWETPVGVHLGAGEAARAVVRRHRIEAIVAGRCARGRSARSQCVATAHPVGSTASVWMRANSHRRRSEAMNTTKRHDGLSR